MRVRVRVRVLTLTLTLTLALTLTLGRVAEKRQVCRSGCEHVPRIAFMSSWLGLGLG